MKWSELLGIYMGMGIVTYPINMHVYIEVKRLKGQLKERIPLVCYQIGALMHYVFWPISLSVNIYDYVKALQKLRQLFGKDIKL